MAESLLVVRGLVKRFGGLVATDHLNLEVRAGEVHALIGPNGAGKTTAIAQLAGEQAQNEGTIHFDGEEITALSTPQRVRRGLARSFQITQVLPDYTALDNVALAVQARQGHGFRFFRNARKEAALRDPAREYLAAVGLAARADVKVADMAHGEQRQLELAVALATGPRLLLLDEPMAGMGPTESREITDVLLRLKGKVTMLLVEHDMEAVFALADRISVLVYGRCIATGTPAEIRENADVRTAYLGEEAA
jgi:branched-chain amino acid transport system ATP-binding protein